MKLRPPNLDDLAAVYAVIAARAAADQAAPDGTLEDLRDQWRGTQFELATDAQVAEDPVGEIVAYAAVQYSGSMAVVAPGCEGRGVGSRLLMWAEARERELGRPLHRQVIAAGNAPGRAVLRAAGYELVRSIWRMGRGLHDLGGGGTIPVGIELGALDVERDAADLHALDARSFSAAPDYVAESLTLFREVHLGARDLAPALSQVARREGDVVGFLLARRWAAEAVGFISILAVDPAQQGLGIGTALMGHAFTSFAAAGLREAQLSVSSQNPTARRLYERLGMKPRFRWDVYEREPDRRPGA